MLHYWLPNTSWLSIILPFAAHGEFAASRGSECPTYTVSYQLNKLARFTLCSGDSSRVLQALERLETVLAWSKYNFYRLQSRKTMISRRGHLECNILPSTNDLSINQNIQYCLVLGKVKSSQSEPRLYWVL